MTAARTTTDPRSQLIANPGIAKALREYKRSADYGKITGDYAALVVARKVTHYAALTLNGTHEQLDTRLFATPTLPQELIVPITHFVQAEKARDEVISEGKLPMFSDKRKAVWDQMRNAARVLADTVATYQ